MGGSAEVANASARRVRRVAARLAVAYGAIAVTVAVVVALGVGAAPTATVHAPWWLLVGLFAAAQASPLHIQVGKQTRSVSLTELPFVIGLLALAPWAFCAVRLSGGLITELAVRRHYRQPVKLVFNSALFVSEGLIGTALFRWAAHGQARPSALMFAAALAASVVANVISAVTVALLIEIVEGRGSVRAVLPVGLLAVAQSAAIGNIGVVASLTLVADEWALVPLLGAVVAFVVGYRAYAAIADRHSRLQHLYTFSRHITGHTDLDAIVTTMLDQMRAVLHAAEVRLVRVGAGGMTEVGVGGAAGPVALERGWLAPGDGWILRHVVQRGRPLLLPRETRDLAAREWLERASLREAMIVPLNLSSEGAVVIVADRLGEIRGFDADDLELLDTLVKQATVELRSAELLERLRHDSLHDAVTGIPNRAALQQAVQERLGRPDGVVVLGMIDLDAFKDVNDSFGHHAGDEMLTCLAERLVTLVGARGDLCRFGGDEFAVALYDASPQEAMLFFREIIDCISEPIVLDGTAIEVGASIGVALAPVHASTWADLVRKADVAMYAAKSAGRASVMFDETLESSGRSRLGLVAALHAAIDNNTIEVSVQPKALLSTGEVVSTEALVRWNHPQSGMVPPSEFIPLAERSGLIRELTALVLDKAVAACAAWQPTAPNIGVAVNVSARCLQDDSLELALERALRRHRLPATLLMLEITESSIMAEPERTSALLDRLRARGIQLSIDDFGTGYSSLSYLRRLPVSEVKIDRSFVARMAESPDDAAVVHAIVELAHTLELTVVAEGVEDDTTWGLLRNAGCDLAQGYLLARPMPAQDFARWYAGYAQPRSDLRTSSVV